MVKSNHSLSEHWKTAINKSSKQEVEIVGSQSKMIISASPNGVLKIRQDYLTLFNMDESMENGGDKEYNEDMIVQESFSRCSILDFLSSDVPQ